jgi:hypothetical protein
MKRSRDGKMRGNSTKRFTQVWVPVEEVIYSPDIFELYRVEHEFSYGVEGATLTGEIVFQFDQLP